MIGTMSYPICSSWMTLQQLQEAAAEELSFRDQAAVHGKISAIRIFDCSDQVHARV